MTKRQEITVTLYEHDIYGSVISGEYGDDSLRDFIEFFQQLLDKVPPEYRDTAAVSIDSCMEYDSAYCAIEVYYKRPETDEEMETRVSSLERDTAKAVARARAEYERLKKRFEG